MEDLCRTSFQHTIQIGANRKTMEDLCRTGISHTIQFGANRKTMEDLCRTGISHTIQFGANRKTMEICAGQVLKALHHPATIKKKLPQRGS